MEKCCCWKEDKNTHFLPFEAHFNCVFVWRRIWLVQENSCKVELCHFLLFVVPFIKISGKLPHWQSLTAIYIFSIFSLQIQIFVCAQLYWIIWLLAAILNSLHCHCNWIIWLLAPSPFPFKWYTFIGFTCPHSSVSAYALKQVLVTQRSRKWQI